MRKQRDSPYRPPAELAQKPSTHQPVAKKGSSSTSGLTLALISLFGPMIICVLAIFGIIEVPWDRELVPAATFMIGVPCSIVALIVSIIAWVRYRTWKSIIGIIAAILAIPVTLAAAWLLAMIGLANHPV